VTPVLVQRSTVSAARVVQPVRVSQVRLATPAVTQEMANRGQRAGFEVAGQEPQRQVRGDAGDEAARQDLAEDGVTGRACQFGEFE
jgi:hypothetical protein